MDKTTEIIERFKLIHGDKFDYSKVEYKNMTNKVCIICPEHGEFYQTPHAHLKGQSCPKCSLEKRKLKRLYTTETFIKKASIRHKNKYNYSKTVYVDSHTKVCIICPEHGEFWQQANNHLHGDGCPECKKYNLSKLNITDRAENFISNANEKYKSKYDYSKVEYVNNSTKVCIICPEHGEFWQTPFCHMQSAHGCPICGENAKNEKHRQTTEDFIKKAKTVHGNKYSYEETVYYNPQTLITITCPIHGDFQQMPYQHLDGCGCQKCAYTTSKYEKEIYDYIKTIDNNIEIFSNNRSILEGYELDIYLPKHNIAIEFNGLFWHSNAKKKNNYHITKTNICNEKNVKLIHIFEDEWIYKSKSCEKLFTDLLTNNTNIDSSIDLINFETAKKFHEENSLYHTKCGDINIGYFSNGNLKDLLSLRKKSNGCFEIVSFGHNKQILKNLFEFFNKNFKPKSVSVKCNLRFQSHKLFQDLGFEIIKTTKPSFFFVQNDKRLKNNKQNSNKGLYKIYDCGQVFLIATFV